MCFYHNICSALIRLKSDTYTHDSKDNQLKEVVRRIVKLSKTDETTIAHLSSETFYHGLVKSGINCPVRSRVCFDFLIHYFDEFFGF